MREFDKTKDYDLIWEAYNGNQLNEDVDWKKVGVIAAGTALGAVVGQHIGSSTGIKFLGALTGAVAGAGAGTLVFPGVGTAIGGLGGGGLGWYLTGVIAPVAGTVIGAVGGYLIGAYLHDALMSGEITEEEAIAQAQEELDGYSEEDKARLPRVQ